MFFAAAPGQPPFAIVDWQSITKSAGAQDLAYYLTQSVDLEVRPRHERDLFARYLDGVHAGGVRDYGVEDLCSTTGSARCTCWPSGRIAATLDLANERGAAIARALSTRSCAALDDLDCGACCRPDRRPSGCLLAPRESRVASLTWPVGGGRP